MPNLALTNAQWRDRVWKPLGFWADYLGRLDALARALTLRRNQIDEENDSANDLSNWTINGAAIGTNTAADGRLFATFTVVGANGGVALFRDAAKAAGDKMASGAGALGTTITLASSNSSGMTATVLLDTPAASNSTVELIVIQDVLTRATQSFLTTDEDADDSVTRVKSFIIDTSRASARSLLDEAIAQFRSEVTTWLAAELSAPESVINEGVHEYDYTPVAGAPSGQVAINREKGVIGWLKDAMNDNTPTAQTIASSAATVGALTSDPDNAGQVVLSSAAVRQNVRTGTVRLVVTGETVGSEQFSVQLELTQPDLAGKRFIVGANPAQIKQPWIDGVMGVSFTLGRVAPTESGDAGGILSSYTVTGENATETDAGIIYFRVLRNAGAPIWTITIYSNSSRTTQVAQTTADGTVGTVTLTLAGAGGMTVTCVFDRAAANAALPAAGNQQDSQIDLEVSRLNESHSFPVTNPDTGNFQRFFARYLGVQLDRAAPASAVVQDGFARVYNVVYDGDEA